ncbi:uncharacterized protein N7483_012615 [Penicillium malachiteum]|uniref:uncharacterized protein n=1 Tax=Penicillium malachiteum TaxID=1324776 RepID=UPI00254798B8|nr:uncharacterized protein N7483_012615 [Penicillium malachiteum]KAJ5715434.1 hypothetical protein N7483_012615 [Penicillium malachiteum]
MSTTTTSTTSSASATSTVCTGNVWELPITDAACGSRITGNMTTVFDDCCKGDSPVKYDGDCGVYCLAQEQTVSELLTCLHSKSNDYQDIFCNDKLNATATAAATSTKSTSTSTGTKTSTGTSTSTSTKNAAVGAQPVSTMGLGVLAMLFCSAVMGVVA